MSTPVESTLIHLLGDLTYGMRGNPLMWKPPNVSKTKVFTAEIARRLKLPVSTLKDYLKRILPGKTTDVYNGGATPVHKVWIRKCPHRYTPFRSR